MRTYVPIGPRPWKPANELAGALERGNLGYAITLAAEVTEDRHGRPIDLDVALRFLPLVAAEQPTYDQWSRRWLIRWLNEREPSIHQAAEVAGMLAELPSEPAGLDGILGLLG